MDAKAFLGQQGRSPAGVPKEADGLGDPQDREENRGAEVFLLEQELERRLGLGRLYGRERCCRRRQGALLRRDLGLDPGQSGLGFVVPALALVPAGGLCQVPAEEYEE